MTKLVTLPSREQKRFDASPIFTLAERRVYFALDEKESKIVQSLRTKTNKVGFILQLGYFKSNAKFFTYDQFRKHDIDYVIKSLGLYHSGVDLSLYHKKSPFDHRKKILNLLSWNYCDAFQQQKIKAHISWCLQRQLIPKQVFMSAIDFCWANKIEVPSYNTLSTIITNAYNQFESGLIHLLEKKLTFYHKEKLDYLAGIKSPQPSNFSKFSLKHINHSMKSKDIHESVEDFKIFYDYYKEFKPIIGSLALPDQATEYFATWVKKARTLQLHEFANRNKLYLYLLCYIKHQVYIRNDLLLDTFLKSVQSIINAAHNQLNKLEKENRAERNKAIRKLSHSNKEARQLINQITQIVTPSSIDQLSSQEAKEKLTLIEGALKDYHEKYNEEETNDINKLEESLNKITKLQNFYEILEGFSLKLQRKTSSLLKVLEFNPANSDFNILNALNHYKATDGTIRNTSPLAFLSNEEQKTVYAKEKLRVSLYKALLCIHVANGVKSGRINLLYSYRYKSIEDYLIDEPTWHKNKITLLTNAGLLGFKDFDFCINNLKYKVSAKYKEVNETFLNNRNPYLTLKSEGKFKISTPKIDSDNKQYVSSLLSHTGYTPIIQVLRSINQISGFAQEFKHFSIKHKKMDPKSSTIFAGIIGKGCNIGIGRIANISTGVSESSLKNVVNWCFSLKNIQKANNKILALMNKLSLSNFYRHKAKELHTGSDGQKINVSVHSLNSNYSYKYFGKGKGVSIYTFLDERLLLFHSMVISSSEREAPYVIDGLLQNEVVKSTIHSTDTYGFTESIFAATHFINTAFAPRIKNISKQKIYSFSARHTYEKKGYKILPSRTINLEIIRKHWDDILRFMATIKLHHTPASQLFKRLSSYAKDNPLYKAIKEFGRIVKTLFILTYLNDVELRQRIEKQLNKVELSNKFSKAVFFANNQELKFSSKEDQEIAIACKSLIQNSIVLWNYLYISQLLANTDNREEREEMIKSLKKSSMISWQHINLHGEYDFTKNAANDDTPFDMSKILNLKVA